MKTPEEIKVGDIIARTTIPDRIVIMIEKQLHTVNLNNGRIFPLEMGDFDVVIGNIYSTESYHSQFEGECEWKLRGLLWITSCDMDASRDTFRQFGKDLIITYCPFCGRKIKQT